MRVLQPVRATQALAQALPLVVVADLDQDVALDAGVAVGRRKQQAAVAAVCLQALLAQQERVLARQTELVQKNFISKNALDEATAQRDALKSQLATAQARAGLLPEVGLGAAATWRPSPTPSSPALPSRLR